MKLELAGSGVLALAALGVAAVAAWKLYRVGSDAASSVGGAISAATGAVEQGIANVRSAVVNAVSAPPEPGEKAFLYSDASYTGRDPFTGLDVMDGARSSEDFRRYEYEQRDAGHAPAASSVAGAAFGVYPSAGRRRANP